MHIGRRAEYASTVELALSAAEESRRCTCPMRTPRPVPAHLRSRAFAREEALEAGITPRMLQHKRFEAIFPSVYRLRGAVLTPRQWIAAARLALPADSRLSHGTALWELGLELGELKPLHFTVARDLHLTIDDIFLHRTEVMPWSGDQRVSVEAAFVGAAMSMRLIDVIAADDWLLNRDYMTKAALAQFIERDPWRPGTASARNSTGTARHSGGWTGDRDPSRSRRLAAYWSSPDCRCRSPTWMCSTITAYSWVVVIWCIAGGGCWSSTKGVSTRRILGSSPATSIAMLVGEGMVGSTYKSLSLDWAAPAR